MGVKTNIEIRTSDGRRLDYTTPEDLKIKLNRIADDYRDPSKRWGEFSYSFSLPKTKNNARIFGFSDVSKVQRKFSINPIDIDIFNKSEMVLSGTLEIQGIKRDSYECIFFSKLTQLVDKLTDLNLQDIDTMPQISNWDYETTIAAHINSGFTSSDQTSYQFPLVYYNTFFTPYSVYQGNNDFEGIAFRDEGDRPQQNFYYLLNRTSTGSDNEFYFHQIPLTFYLKSLLEGLLEYVGWSLSGSFWETDEAKQIIMLYTGENDIYDAAVYTSGGTTYLDTNKFIPDIDALSFISDIVNMFNLYLNVDTNNKTLIMETYDTVFGHKISPYRLDNKIDKDTVEIERIDEYDFSIKFSEPNNKNHLGDNYFFGAESNNALTTSNYKKTSNSLFEDTYNHIGESDSSIELSLSAPKVKRMYIRNTDNFNNTITNALDHVIFLPDMSEQTRYDNNNTPFNKSTGDTTVFNEEDSVKFKGKPTLMYYYGVSTSDFIQATGKGSCSDYFYFDFDNTKQKIGLASPFAWKSYRNSINTQLGESDSGSTASMYASYLQTIYLNMGTGYTGNNRYSLIFGDSHGLCDTLYTKFYRNRTTRYRDSEILSANIRLNNVDFGNMQINQPLIYQGEIYSLVEIKDYDIVNGNAKIKLIKQI